VGKPTGRANARPMTGSACPPSATAKEGRWARRTRLCPPYRYGCSFSRRPPESAQAGVDFVERRGAWAQRLFTELVERRFHGVEMAVQVFRLRIDIKQPGHDLSLGGMLLQEAQRPDPVMRVVIRVELAQRQLAAVMLLD